MVGLALRPWPGSERTHWNDSIVRSNDGLMKRYRGVSRRVLELPFVQHLLIGHDLVYRRWRRRHYICWWYAAGYFWPQEQLPKMIDALQNTLSSLSGNTLSSLWFAAKRLKINANKTQLIMIGSKPMLKNVPNISLNILRSCQQCSCEVQWCPDRPDARQAFVAKASINLLSCPSYVSS